MSDLETIDECFPIEICPGCRAVPGVVVFPAVPLKQSKLIPYDLSGLRRRHGVKVIAKLILKAYRRGLSGVKINEDEPLRSNVGVDLEERVLLGIEVREIVVFSGFVQLASGQVRPER